MNAKAALCYALLKGETLNVKNCFTTIGLTNCAREISRMVETPFGITVSRTRMEGESRYGSHCTWVNYKLKDTPENREGRLKMKEYIAAQIKNPKTERELQIFKTITLL